MNNFEYFTTDGLYTYTCFCLKFFKLKSRLSVGLVMKLFEGEDSVPKLIKNKQCYYLIYLHSFKEYHFLFKVIFN